MPQSFNRKLIFFFPIFFFSKILIVSKTASSGAFKLSKKFELKITPGPVYASFVTLKSLFSFKGLTTVLISNLYLIAKSKSLWSCAGHPNTAPKTVIH